MAKSFFGEDCRGQDYNVRPDPPQSLFQIVPHIQASWIVQCGGASLIKLNKADQTSKRYTKSWIGTTGTKTENVRYQVVQQLFVNGYKRITLN